MNDIVTKSLKTNLKIVWLFYTHFDDLKNIAHPSTYFLSFSDIVLALDFGEKMPS